MENSKQKKSAFVHLCTWAACCLALSPSDQTSSPNLHVFSTGPLTYVGFLIAMIGLVSFSILMMSTLIQVFKTEWNSVRISKYTSKMSRHLRLRRHMVQDFSITKSLTTDSTANEQVLCVNTNRFQLWIFYFGILQLYLEEIKKVHTLLICYIQDPYCLIPSFFFYIYYLR